MTIESNNFADACYDMNSIADFEQALIEGPDATDMKIWGLTENEWTEQIELALAEKRADAENE